MPLLLKTVKSVRKFCQQLALESTKVMKVGIFLELDTLDLYPVHFGIIDGLVTSFCQAFQACTVKPVYNGHPKEMAR